jgi:C-terminal processing protease CtpA/Prc
MKGKYVIGQSAAVILVFAFTAPTSWSQKLTSTDRAEVQAMLRDIASDVTKHYYDPLFHGIDWGGKVKDAKEKIDTTDSMNMALSYIAAALDSLHDSHTYFLPPPRPYTHDYGFQMQMIGGHCYVIRVRPSSDAEAKGLKPGDEILKVNGITPTREDFSRMEYLFQILRPQPGFRLDIRRSSGVDIQIDVMAKIRELAKVIDYTSPATANIPLRAMDDLMHAMHPRYVERGDGLLIVKLPVFFLSTSEIDSVLGKMRKHGGVVLDLRGNPGGSEESLRFFLGGLFENGVKIGDRHERESTKAVEAKNIHNEYTGKLIVLVDGDSDSASELFARVIQIEKRGIVIGDRSAGNVMGAKRYSYHVGLGTTLFYGASITEADFIMTDGQSLEHRGVTPDLLVLPTPDDLATGRDPVIAKAADVLGVKIAPEEAGTFFPYEWPKENK